MTKFYSDVARIVKRPIKKRKSSPKDCDKLPCVTKDKEALQTLLRLILSNYFCPSFQKIIITLINNSNKDKTRNALKKNGT